MAKNLHIVTTDAAAAEAAAELKAKDDPKASPGADVSQNVAEPAAVRTRRKGPRRIVYGAGIIAIVAAAGYYGHDYWVNGRFQVSTDDAYVQADNSSIAPKISGYLTKVLVQDNQLVKAGQPLARIDDRDFQAALDQAKADVAAAQATLEAEEASLDIQQSTIAAARATIDVDRANETYAEQNNKRYESLATNGYAALQTAQQAASQIAAAQASIVRDTAALAGATKQVDLLKAQISQARAALEKSQAVQHQAELNLSYTTILAPVDGTVGNRTLRLGQYVQAGTPLMTVVPTDAAYVVANYKETQLTDVRAGQPVNIEVDMFPGKVFHGHVDSLAPASGQEFALLPPDNATGNFTKVVQRIPVRIALDPQTKQSGDLRPGMSVEPSIDTKTDAAQQD